MPPVVFFTIFSHFRRCLSIHFPSAQQTLRKVFCKPFVWGRPNTTPGCLERLRACSKPDWTQSWSACSRWPRSRQEFSEALLPKANLNHSVFLYCFEIPQQIKHMMTSATFSESCLCMNSYSSVAVDLRNYHPLCLLGAEHVQDTCEHQTLQTSIHTCHEFILPWIYSALLMFILN